MPCEECENGKVKWGKTGDCQYDSIAECEAANKDYKADIDALKIRPTATSDTEVEVFVATA